VGCGADIGNGGEERALPEVVGLPTGDLIEQLQFDAAVQRRGPPAPRTGACAGPAPPELGQGRDRPFQPQRTTRG